MESEGAPEDGNGNESGNRKLAETWPEGDDREDRDCMCMKGIKCMV